MLRMDARTGADAGGEFEVPESFLSLSVSRLSRPLMVLLPDLYLFFPLLVSLFIRMLSSLL